MVVGPRCVGRVTARVPEAPSLLLATARCTLTPSFSPHSGRLRRIPDARSGRTLGVEDDQPIPLHRASVSNYPQKSYFFKIIAHFRDDVNARDDTGDRTAEYSPVDRRGCDARSPRHSRSIADGVLHLSVPE